MHTPGPPPLAAHWASDVQATHVFVPVSQMGLPGAEQSALVTHSTHRPFVAQAGVGALHAPAPAAWHPTHAFATQKLLAGSAVHSAPVEHSTHRLLLASQTGLAPEHAPGPACMQPAQVFATQKAFAGSAVHWAASTHSAQRPDCALQVPVGAWHAVGPAP
ncbi:MAG: hypothetical protein SFX73_08550 [Kofleriaceae bacterium]|nr:hypothetical protein [Kofleriaceae bacterium]